MAGFILNSLEKRSKRRPRTRALSVLSVRTGHESGAEAAPGIDGAKIHNTDRQGGAFAQQVISDKQKKPRRSGVVLRALGKLCGYFVALPPEADAGQAEAHQCEGGGFGHLHPDTECKILVTDGAPGAIVRTGHSARVTAY